jgi:hypothetical protein
LEKLKVIHHPHKEEEAGIIIRPDKMVDAPAVAEDIMPNLAVEVEGTGVMVEAVEAVVVVGMMRALLPVISHVQNGTP